MIVRPSLGHVSRSSLSAQPAGFPLRRTATLAGAATLMLLLAACGGGSGGSSRDKAVSSSPTPPTNQAQNAGTTGTGSSSNSGTVNGGSSGNGATGGQTHAGGSTGSGGTGHAGSGNTNAGTGGSGGTSGGQGAGSSSGSGAGGSNPGQGHGAAGGGSAQPGGHAGGGNAGGSSSGGSNAGNGSTGNIGRWGPAPSISARGISGDVLATMINQPGSLHPGDVLLNDGKPHPNEAYAPVSFQALRWSAQPPAGQAVTGEALRVHQAVLADTKAGSYTYYTSLDAATADHTSRENTHNLWVEVNFGSTVKGFAPRRVDSLASMAGVPVGTPLLTLQTQARVLVDQIPGYVTPQGRTFTLKGSQPFVVEKGALVPFNQVLRHWSGQDGAFLQVFVANGGRSDEARLCLNVHAPLMKRLSCVRYAVPAGWKLGQPLVRLGHYVVDDQSPVASRRDLRYWNATAADLPKHPQGY